MFRGFALSRTTTRLLIGSYPTSAPGNFLWIQTATPDMPWVGRPIVQRSRAVKCPCPSYLTPENPHISTPTLIISSPSSRQTSKISKFWKSKMAAAAILKITKIAISQQRIDRSSWNLAWWCKMALLTTQTVKNCIWKMQDGWQPPFWKPLNRHISTTVWCITGH